MKIFQLSVLLLCFSITCKSQDSLLFKFDGYCGGIKLSEINAKYGEAAFTNKASIIAGTVVKQFVFDYGQYYKKDKEALITNAKGDLITFGSITMVLNFFDYNGWEFVNKLDEGNSYILLFRKKAGG